MAKAAQDPEPAKRGTTTRPDSPLSRKAKSELRRAEIIAAARDLFSHHGYRGTGLAEVAARVGITLPGVLYHFGTKEALLQAVVAQRDLDSVAFARELYDLGGVASMLALITSARRNREQPEISRLFSVLVAENLDADAPLHAHFVERYRILRSILAAGLRRGLERGEIRPGIDPDRKAAEIIATLDGLSTQWLLDPDEVDLADAVEHYVNGLIAAYGTGHSS